jgi:acetolactate synthase-1/2/3 large subunit
MHQERHFPGRPSGTALTNPNYAIFAQAHGCFGEVVHKTSDFGDIFRRALAQDGPSLIELRISPCQLTPDMKLS